MGRPSKKDTAAEIGDLGKPTAENAPELLSSIPCPLCDGLAGYETFRHETTNHVGLRCLACGRRHPLRTLGVQWLAQGNRRPSNDLVTVMEERGAYCWLCGTDKAVVEPYGIGFQVHHTRPYADHGEEVAKIPLCAICHEIGTAVQRHHRRLFRREGAET